MPSFFERPKIGKPVAAALAAVVVLVVLAAAVVLAYRAGADSTAATEPESAASLPETSGGLEGADEVHDPLQLIDGSEYDDELFVFRGYEQTYAGAVSAAADWLSAYGGSLDADYSEQLGAELLADDAKQTPEDWRSWPENRREDLGLASTGEVPDGWGLNAAPMAYQTRNASVSEIEVILLIRLTGTSPHGSTSANTVLSMDLVWTGQDWADAGYDSGVDHSDLEVDIGEETSALAQTLGWHQLTY